MSIKKNSKTIAGNYTVANINDFKNELAEATQEGFENKLYGFQFVQKKKLMKLIIN